MSKDNSKVGALEVQEDSKRREELNLKIDLMIPMLTRLLAILEPEEAADDALYMQCVREDVRGNRKPIDAYLRRGGKIPHIEKPTKRQAGLKSARG